MSDAEYTTGMQRGRPFKPGQSGNPAGRPKGARNRSTIAAESLLEGEAEALTRKAIELALAGDTTALRLCMERLVPPRKDRAVWLDLPAIGSADDANAAMGAVLAAVAAGNITPSEATAVAALIDAARAALRLDPPLPMAQPVLQVRFVGGGGVPAESNGGAVG